MAKNEMDVSNLVNPLAEGGEMDVSQIVAPMPMGEMDLTQAVSPLAPGQLPPEMVTGVPEQGGLPDAPLSVTQTSANDNTTTTNGTTTSTTSQEKTPETVEAEEDAAKAAESAKVALQAEADAKDKEAQAQIEFDQADNDVIAQVESSKMAARQQGIYEVEDLMNQYRDKAIELTNQKPETFWGSKDTADKIAASISVGLGAFGQALLGSGQNIGQVLLQRQMGEFDRNIENKRQAQLKQLESLKVSADQKRAMLDEVDKIADAHKLAARAKVQADLGKGITLAKTASVKAAIGQKMAAVDQDKAKLEMDQAAKYENRVTQNINNNVVKTIQNNSKTITGPGAGGKLTEGQSKARMTYADIATANQTLKGMDLHALNDDPSFQKYMTDKASRKAADNIPFVGKAFSAAGDSIVGTPEQRLTDRNPDANRAVNAMNTWTQAVTRFKTGAVIGPDEVESERAVYFPIRGDTPEIINDKARTRKELEKALRQAGALHD